MTMKSSEIINNRLLKVTNGIDLEEFFRPEYYRQLKECLDIIDIDYSVTAVGILGKALENQLKEYIDVKIKSKNDFSVNNNNHTIRQIKKNLHSINHAMRLNLANCQLIKLNSGTIEYKLKRKILKDEDFNEMMNISRARNDAFHGCDDERYREIEGKAYTYIERGVVILAVLEKINTA